MIADADVLLRILQRDRGAHGRAARARVGIARAGEPIGVLAATVLEVAFVLESSAAEYGWNRAAVASAVRAIVDEPGFAVEHDEALRAAATTYGDRAIDLHDCYLDAIARERGTQVLSFDADLARLGTGERPVTGWGRPAGDGADARSGCGPHRIDRRRCADADPT